MPVESSTRGRKTNGFASTSAGRLALTGLCLLFVACSDKAAQDATLVQQPDKPPAAELGQGLTQTEQVSSARADFTPANLEWTHKIEEVLVGKTPTLQCSQPAGSISDLLIANDKLEDLLLDGGGVEDSDNATIARLTKLVHLRIRLDPLSDRAAVALVGLEQSTPAVESLQILNWPHSTLSADGIRELAKLKRLRQLRLGGARIDDLAARELARLPELRSLHLIRPQFTAAALQELASSPKLSSLYIDECPLPDAAWEGLFAAKPKLHVHIDQAHHDLDPSQHH